MMDKIVSADICRDTQISILERGLEREAEGIIPDKKRYRNQEDNRLHVPIS